jgi:hypothetical protein
MYLGAYAMYHNANIVQGKKNIDINHKTVPLHTIDSSTLVKKSLPIPILQINKPVNIKSYHAKHWYHVDINGIVYSLRSDIYDTYDRCNFKEMCVAMEDIHI